MRFTLLFLLLFPVLTAFAQEDFQRFYGETFVADDEQGYFLEMIQGEPTVIGVRQDEDTGMGNIGGFSFDPATGQTTASYRLENTDPLFLQQSYPTPDGGFIVTYLSSTSFNLLFTYVNSDFTERWTRLAPATFDTPINITFDKDGTVIFLYADAGQIGSSTLAVRYNLEDGTIIENVDLMLFGNDVPLHLTPLEDGYLIGGVEFVNGGGSDRAFLRRVTDDFEPVWVEYVDNIGNGRMFNVAGATQVESGEIWATGYVGVGFTGKRGLLRFSPEGDLLKEEVLDGAASTIEKITWTETGFLSQDNTNGFGNFYCVVNIKEGEDAEVITNYQFGLPSNPDPDPGYTSALYLPASQFLLAVVDDFFDTPGDKQMLVDRTDLGSSEITRLDFGINGGNQNEYARQLARHPNGRDLIILASAGRPDGGASGAQLTVVDPDDGDVLEVVFPSDRINRDSRQFIDTRPDGQLVVVESEDDVATFSFLDNDLEVTDQFDQPNNLQYATAFTGLSLRDGRFVVTEDQFNPEVGSDHQLVFHDADGTPTDSVFTSGYVEEMVQLNTNQLLTVGFDFTANNTFITSALQSFDLTTGDLSWRNILRSPGCSQTRITDVQRILGDRLAVSVLSFQCGVTGLNDLEYRVYSATGELEVSTSLPLNAQFTSLPKLSPRADGGEISLAITENPEENVLNVRLFRLNSRSGEVLSDTTFTGFTGNFLNIDDLQYLRGNRLAILGTGQSEPTPSSADILLIVTGSEQLVNTSERTLDVGVALSPNPTPGLVNVSLSGISNGTYDLRMLSADGRLVARAQVRGNGREAGQVFDLGDRPTGVYALVVSDEQGATLTKRLVKR